jgi:hypothetical protein
MGVWIGASYALGRDVPVDEPYTHICRRRVRGRMTPHLDVVLDHRACAACAEERAANPPRKDARS